MNFFDSLLVSLPQAARGRFAAVISVVPPTGVADRCQLDRSGLTRFSVQLRLGPNDLTFSRRERKKRLNLEGGQFTRELP